MKISYLDDLPLIGFQLRSFDLSSLLCEHFPDHGLWKGISGGKLAEGWLLYILSEADHRLSHVQDWAEQRLDILGAIVEESDLRGLDFSDDRLGRLLDRYSDDDSWHSFEQSLGKRLLRVYQLENSPSVGTSSMHVFRTDSFNVPQFRAVDSLFTYGYSKHRRSDQPFCKVMLSAMDPMAVPFAVDILKGGGSDTNHYWPVIERVQSIVGHCGNLYVGDSKMGSTANRAQIHRSGNYYLCPLGNKQCTVKVVQGYLDQIEKPFDQLPSLFSDHPNRKTAYFFLSNMLWKNPKVD